MSLQHKDIECISEKYPALEMVKREDSYVFLGNLVLDHVYNDVRMTGKFNLEIEVPGDFPLALPTVKELSNYIDEDYPHRYEDKKLCLASNLELKMFFSQDTNICSFIEKYIFPYLYTYRFYKEYGIYPYGERSHGTMGDLEYLKDLFGVNDWKQVFDIMIFVIRFPYRGHLLCPCGSGKKIRNCHGNVLRRVIDAKLQYEFMLILLEIEKVFEREAEKWKM